MVSLAKFLKRIHRLFEKENSDSLRDWDYQATHNSYQIGGEESITETRTSRHQGALPPEHSEQCGSLQAREGTAPGEESHLLKLEPAVPGVHKAVNKVGSYQSDWETS